LIQRHRLARDYWTIVSGSAAKKTACVISLTQPLTKIEPFEQGHQVRPPRDMIIASGTSTITITIKSVPDASFAEKLRRQLEH